MVQISSYGFLCAPTCSCQLHHLHPCMHICLLVTHSDLSALLLLDVECKIWELAMQSCMCCDGFCWHMGGTSAHWWHWPVTHRSVCPTATGWQPRTCCADLQVSFHIMPNANFYGIFSRCISSTALYCQTRHV